MAEMTFKIKIKNMNYEQKKEMLKDIFYTYIKLIQKNYNLMCENPSYYYYDKLKKKEEHYEIYFNYTIKESEELLNKNKSTYSLYSPEIDFLLQLDRNNEDNIKGETLIYPPATISMFSCSIYQMITHQILSIYKDNIVYLNVSVEALDLLDQGDGHEYFDSIETFLDFLDKNKKIDFNNKSKQDFIYFLENENIINKHGEIDLTSDSKYLEKTKIFNYLIENEFIKK